jgi:GTPase SAR1 family protein
MSFIDAEKKEINCKIVYYGPGLAGKTTNLHYIHDNSVTNKGKLISVASETDRRLVLNYLPSQAATINGMKLRLHLYCVPG